jgi:transcriptional regulator with XRE-family HTH domain
MKSDPDIQRITEQRKGAGISQKALALEAGLRQSHLSALESGFKFYPRASTVSKLRQALGRLLVEAHDDIPALRAKPRKKSTSKSQSSRLKPNQEAAK